MLCLNHCCTDYFVAALDFFLDNTYIKSSSSNSSVKSILCAHCKCIAVATGAALEAIYQNFS